jgi:hypothetical protein
MWLPMSAYDQLSNRRRVLRIIWLAEILALPFLAGLTSHTRSFMNLVFYSWLVAIAITMIFFARALRCPVCHKTFPTGFRSFPIVCPRCHADFTSVEKAKSLI